jgi:hypothetical protein
MQRRADGMGAAQREVRRAGMAETGEAARALIALRARIVTGGLCAGGRLAEIPLAEEAALIGAGDGGRPRARHPALRHVRPRGRPRQPAVPFVPFLVAELIAASPFGLSLHAIRADPRRAAALGAPVKRRLGMAHAQAASCAGAAVAVMALAMQSVPLDAPSFQRPAEGLLMLAHRAGGGGKRWRRSAWNGKPARCCPSATAPRWNGIPACRRIDRGAAFFYPKGAMSTVTGPVFLRYRPEGRVAPEFEKFDDIDAALDALEARWAELRGAAPQILDQRKVLLLSTEQLQGEFDAPKQD